MRRRRALGLLALVLLLVVGGICAYIAARQHVPPGLNPFVPKPYSREAFDEWLREDPVHAAQFDDFSNFLAARKLDQVVPAWQLTRTDSERSSRCKRPQFLVPPREKWPRIVPVLELVREHIEPAIGPLEAVSAYRTVDFNGCIGGASRSQHISFAAVDFIAPGQSSNRALFMELCAIQRKLGPPSHLGLGAYFDPLKPGKNRRGRFHIDTAGFRNWGPSYRAESSACSHR